MSESMQAALADALQSRFHAVYPDGASFAVDAAYVEGYLAGRGVEWAVYDDYKYETDAAMNFGQGYVQYQFEAAEAAFIAATRSLDRLRREKGLPPLSLKDLAASLHDGNEGSDEGETKGDGGADPTHVKPPRTKLTEPPYNPPARGGFA